MARRGDSHNRSADADRSGVTVPRIPTDVLDVRGGTRNGLSRGELRSLQWHDVQDDVLVLTAEKSKTKRKRLIPISPTLRRVLDRRRKGPDGVELPVTAHVFCNAVGEPIPRRLSNSWRNVARRKAGIDDLHFHDLHEHQDDQHLPECDDAGREAGAQEAGGQTSSPDHQGCSWPADGPRVIDVNGTTTA